MAEVIRMPKMSDTMEEGVIAQWLVKEGDVVKSGDILAEVETDKATMELESYEDGTLLYVGVKDGDSIPIDGVLAIIGEKGESYEGLLSEVSQASTAPAAESAQPEVEVQTVAAEAIDVSGINATTVTMPKMSDTMTEGVIASWLKKVGDEVKSGDILAEVETDKATMELESYEDGTLLYIGAEAGDSVAIDGVIAIIGEKGADYETLLKAEASKQASVAEDTNHAPKPEAVEEAAQAPAPVTPQATTQENGRVKASPLAKRLAVELGYKLSDIKGSGDAGRIVKRDVETHVPATSSQETATTSVAIPAVVGEESYEEVAVSQMRKTIAKRLAESKFTSPHFYLTMEIDMDNAIAARKSLNEVSPVKISFNDLVVKAVAASLRQHPKVNAAWLGDKIRYNKHIHIGVAVAVEEGLLVPVIRFADSKSLSHISVEVKDLAGKAHDKKLQPSDWEGNTFTISNLGMFGIEEFTAIINSPDACIMAVGGIKQTPVVKNGEVVPGNVMKVTMSCDHRVVDGAVGSAFLQTFKQLLEDPVRILI
jgi:pyruvate dehydrogenase E2 component (dihydrolipoamide acetyltransferase)